MKEKITLSQNGLTAIIILGFGFLWAWLSLSFFSLTLFSSAASPMSSVEIANCISLTVSALITIPIIIINQDFSNKLVSSRLFVILAGFFGFLGSIILLSSSGKLSLIVIGAVFVGVTEFFLFYSYCTKVIHNQISGPAISMVFSCAVLIAAAITLLMLPFDKVIAGVVCALLPLLAAVLLCFTGHFCTIRTKVTGFDEESTIATEEKGGNRIGKNRIFKTPKLRFQVPWRLILGLSLFGIVFGFMQLSSGAEVLDDYNNNHLLHVLARGSAALITLIVVVLLKRGYWFLGTAGVICFLIGLITYTTPMVPIDMRSVFFITFGFTCIELLIWVILFEFYLETKISWNAAYGAIKGITILATAAGTIFAFFGSNYLSDSILNSITMVLIAGMVLTSISLFGFKDIATLWSYRGKKNLIELRDANTITEQVLNSFGLSSRECEVARLLMMGRSEPFISEELFISHHTTHSHVVHIYRKMKVHSRQEFLSVIEQACSDLKT